MKPRALSLIAAMLLLTLLWLWMWQYRHIPAEVEPYRGQADPAWAARRHAHHGIGFSEWSPSEGHVFNRDGKRCRL